MKIGNAFCLGRNIKGAGAQRVLGCDTNRAVIGVTGLRLNAADGKHEPARGIAPVSAKRECARDIESRDNLTSRANLDIITQAGAAQSVVHKRQTFDQRHANMVGEFDGRCAGTALGPVNDDKIRLDACLQHGLDHAHEFATVPYAQFEPNRFATGKVTQLGNELHQFDGC